MLDIKLIRENPEKINELLKRRNPDLSIDTIIAIDADRRKVQAQADELRAKRKSESQKIGMMKKNGENTDAIQEEVRKLGDEIKELEENKDIIRNKLKIKASINNAKIFKDIKEEYGSFRNYLLTFTDNKIYYEITAQHEAWKTGNPHAWRYTREEFSWVNNPPGKTKQFTSFAEKRQDLQEQRPVKKWMLSLIQKLKNLNMKHKNLRLMISSRWQMPIKDQIFAIITALTNAKSAIVMFQK